MPFSTYGVLLGQVTSHEDQPGGNPHYQLDMSANGVYRVAVNLESTFDAGQPISELQYQIVDLSAIAAAKPMLDQLRAAGAKPGFTVTAGTTGPALDFVKDGWLDMTKFVDVGASYENNPFYDSLVGAAQRAVQEGALVAVFGTGFPDPTQSSTSGRRGRGAFNPASARFQGVHDVHMNQGSFATVDGIRQSFYDENAPRQDGAVIFFFKDGTAPGYFTKFQTQDTATDSHGNPVHTGVPELDAMPANVIAKTAKPEFSRVAAMRRRSTLSPSVPPNKMPAAGFRFAGVHEPDPAVAIATPATTAGAASAPPGPPVGGDGRPTVEGPASAGSGGTPAGGFLFQDTNAGDVGSAWVDENDTKQDQKWAEQYGSLQTVPGPRAGVPLQMTLASVIGQAACDAATAAGQIVFHSVGDTGSVSHGAEGNEQSVADGMTADFTGGANDPKFLFHLGDVVYFYGEEQFYSEQFYQPFKAYPAPIFAIPGNHDGLTYNTTMESLAGFKAAFVDDQPRFWQAAAGIKRTTMTQPGVYFTLDAPLVSIIGLYSNCSEGPGILDQQQLLFLHSELARLKPLRESGAVTAVLLAVHHPPLSASAVKPGSPVMLSDIETACSDNGFYPDAVLSGHAHLYQRIVRTPPAFPNRQVPFMVAGGGGYGVRAKQEVDKTLMAQLDQSDTAHRLHQMVAHFGYMTITVAKGTPSTLKIAFRSTSPGGYSDGCVVNLDTHQLM